MAAPAMRGAALIVLAAAAMLAAAPVRADYYAGKPLDALHSGFDATMKDPQFLADADKLRIDVSPLSGTRVQELVQRLYASPKDIVMRARWAITP